MLKFNELSPKEKVSRYRWSIEVPFFLVLFLLTAFEVNILLICIVYVTVKIFALALFGVLNDERTYSINSLMIDSAILYFITILQVLFITTPIKDFLGISFENNYSSHVFTVLLSLLMIEAYWYLVLIIQRFYFKNENKWKVRVSGLFNSSLSFRNQTL